MGLRCSCEETGPRIYEAATASYRRVDPYNHNRPKLAESSLAYKKKHLLGISAGLFTGYLF
jgi:hypothetical protein